jgi:hypothetical protein
MSPQISAQPHGRAAAPETGRSPPPSTSPVRFLGGRIKRGLRSEFDTHLEQVQPLRGGSHSGLPEKRSREPRGDIRPKKGANDRGRGEGTGYDLVRFAA